MDGKLNFVHFYGPVVFYSQSNSISLTNPDNYGKDRLKRNKSILLESGPHHTRDVKNARY